MSLTHEVSAEKSLGSPHHFQVLVALRKLEECVSYPLVAWMDGVYAEDEFSAVFTTDLFANVVESAETVSELVGTVHEFPAWTSAWQATADLVRSLRTEDCEPAWFVDLFLAVRALRESLAEVAGISCPSALSPAFIERLRLGLT